MSIIRCVVTLHRDGLLPEDEIQNRFHFESATSPASGAELISIVNRVYAQYAAILPSMSVVLNGDTTFTCYDMDDVPPRVPVFTTTGVNVAPGTTGFPSEVAVTMSFQATPISGTPQARRRNRVFLGPLATALASTISVADVRVSATLLALVDTFGTNLLAANDASAIWVVRSELTGDTAPVANGWVDNAFDTQRRRGADATTRSVF